MNTYTFDKVFRLFLSAALAVGFFFLLEYLADVLIPFFLAFLLAYLLNPLVVQVQRKVKHRALAVSIVMITVLCGILGVLAILIPYIFHEIQIMSVLIEKFIKDPSRVEQLNAIIESKVWSQLQHQIKLFFDGWRDWVQNEDHWGLMQQIGSKVLPKALGVLNGAGTLLTSLLGLIVVLLYLIFMLSDYQRFKQEGLSFIPTIWQKPLLEFFTEFDEAMHLYFRAQAILALIVGVIFALGFSIIGLPMAILLGLGIGLLNMVPYLQIVGIIPAALLAIVHSLEVGAHPLSTLFWVGIVFVVAQVIQEAILTPKLMGKVTGLSPALILLSISIWGKLLGFLGLIIAIPITCLFVAYWARYQKMVVKALDTSNS